jgi:hypothetical protein
MCYQEQAKEHKCKYGAGIEDLYGPKLSWCQKADPLQCCDCYTIIQFNSAVK